MDITDLIDSLPFTTFTEIRKAVIKRHQRHSEEITKAVEYLSSQDILVKAIGKKRRACEKVLSEKCDISPDVASKAVDRFLQIRRGINGNRIDKPFKK